MIFSFKIYRKVYEFLLFILIYIFGLVYLDLVYLDLVYLGLVYLDIVYLDIVYLDLCYNKIRKWQHIMMT